MGRGANRRPVGEEESRGGGRGGNEKPRGLVDPGGGGGGWGIRTPEGLHPTRFPSVRHRPLGESSRCSTRRQPRATRKEYIGPPIVGASPGRWDLSREAGLAAPASARTHALPPREVREPYGASSSSGGGGRGLLGPVRNRGPDRVVSRSAPRAASSSESPRTGR